MSHHGTNPINNSEEEPNLFAKQMLEAAKKMQSSAKELGLGPTDQFPNGKIAEHDEGEIQIAIAHHQGKVIINFGSPVAFVGFTPEQAIDIANLLISHSEAARTEPR